MEASLFLSHFLFVYQQKKKSESDDEFEMEEDVSVAPRARAGGRTKGAVKYNFGESSEESDF